MKAAANAGGQCFDRRDCTLFVYAVIRLLNESRMLHSVTISSSVWHDVTRYR